MKIEVYYEPESVFLTRVSSMPKSFKFNDFLDFVDMARGFKEGNDSKNILSSFNSQEKYTKNHICIINVSDMVGLKSFVFEKINYYFEILREIDVEKVIINNPTRILMSNLELQSNVKIHNKLAFGKIEIAKINKMKEKLDSQIIGQQDAKRIIYRKLIVQHIRSGNKPLVIMFYGNPGIGKTEIAKIMGKSLFGSNEILREQMSMSAGSTSLQYFKATEHSENSFSKQLLNRKSNILLLDEFALAPDYIQTSFYQLFDEGRFVDQNFSVDMRNSIIICTSNFISKQQMKDAISPALFSRFDAVIHFDDFTENEKILVADKILDEYIASETIDSEYVNALDIDMLKLKVHSMVTNFSNFRSIHNLIEDVIADQLIKDDIFK